MRAGEVADVEGLPLKESLERVVTTAFARAYPARHRGMMAWLRNRPDSPDDSSKAVTWTIMAAWFGKHGCTDFLRRAIWQDPALGRQLQIVMQETRLPGIEQRLREILG